MEVSNLVGFWRGHEPAGRRLADPGPCTPKDVQTLVVDETGLVEGKIVLPARIFSRCMSR